MVFRETGTLYTGLKVGRMFFILLLFIPIYEDIVKTNSRAFWIKLINFTGIFYACIVFLNYISPELSQLIFSEIHYMAIDNAWDTGASRAVIKSNYGILFIHIAFIIRILNVLIRKHKIGFLEVFLLTAMFFQGWRAILIAILFSLCFLLFLLKRFKFLPILFKYLTIGLIVIMPIDFFVNQVISSKIVSVYSEIAGDREGTLAGRFNRAEIHVIPEFLNRPLVGHGFISEKYKTEDIDTIKQKSYDKTYLLYNFDYGYLTMLIMFGILIFTPIIFIFLIILFKTYKFIYKNKSFQVVDGFFVFFLALLIANYSFGGLISYTGLLPLAFLIGIAQAEMTLSQKKNNFSKKNLKNL
jgi:hypothetical protein